MNHNRYFDNFLNDHINLNKTRLDRLERSVQAVTDLLKDKHEGYRKYLLQGSYAHKTIIKPVQENDEFDADIQIYIKDDSFNPRATGDNYTDYVGKIHGTLKNDGNYADKLSKKTRCVTINYAEDFHLDVVPCIEHNNQVYICNGRERHYERTDGEGYKIWLLEKNKAVGANNLRKVTRVLKFLRDHKDNFSVKSILLTTLLGERVNAQENKEEFRGLPQALHILSKRLNAYLQSHQDMPTIPNPVLLDEDFNRHWDQTKYSNFRNKFNIYFKKIEEAIDEKDHNKSVKLWRELLGDQFGESKKVRKIEGVIGIGASSVSIAATKPYAK